MEKKTLKHEIGICQGCLQRHVIRNGNIVLHGYSRSGIGYIEGRCAGVGELPFEKSCELTKEIAANTSNKYIQEHLENWIKNWKLKDTKFETVSRSENDKAIAALECGRIAKKFLVSLASGNPIDVESKYVEEILKLLGYKIEKIVAIRPDNAHRIWKHMHALMHNDTIPYAHFNSADKYDACTLDIANKIKTAIENLNMITFVPEIVPELLSQYKVNTLLSTGITIEENTRGLKSYDVLVRIQNAHVISKMNACLELSKHPINSVEFFDDAVKNGLCEIAASFVNNLTA